MKTAPDPGLKAVQVAVANSHGTPFPVILFDDGSIWRRCREIWYCVWPAPEHARESNDSDLWGEQLAKMKSTGGKWHVMPGPVQIVSRHADDVQRIADLEAQIKAWKESANMAPVEVDPDEVCEVLTPGDLAEYITDLYQQALKAQADAAKASAEVSKLKEQIEDWKKAAVARDAAFVDQFYSNGITPENLERALRSAQSWLNQSKHEIDKNRQIAELFPLNAWRILATALKLFNKFAEDESRLNRDRLEAKAAACAIDAFAERTLLSEPYDCTSL